MKLLEESEEQWQKVIQKFGKSVKCLDEDVEALKMWLKSQPHLPELLDERSLRNFIILNKFSVEVTKQKIDNYYTIRSNLREVYSECNPKLQFNEDFCKAVYLVLYPDLTDNLYRVFYHKVKDKTLMDTYEPVNFMKRLILMEELRLRQDVMFGDVMIIDCQDISLTAALKMTPTLIYRGFVLIYEKIFSIRLKGIYLINLPSYGAIVLQHIKKFLNPKLGNRIHILTDPEALKEVIPVENLPMDFGGKGLSLQFLQDLINEKLKQNQDLFDKLDKIKVNEPLRPEKIILNDLMGVYGNFKKLEVD